MRDDTLFRVVLIALAIIPVGLMALALFVL